MPGYQLTLADRWHVAWSDKRIRRRALRLAVMVGGSTVAWAMGRLCVHLPDALEPTCHWAAEHAGKLARVLALAMGGG